MCPSARCEPGATLLGIVNTDGTVGFVSPEAQVDETFVEIAHRGRAPESRFRFAAPCQEGACRHWSGHECRLISTIRDEAIAHGVAGDRKGRVPACAIRPRCRWYAQEGLDACRVCPMVVTETAAAPIARG
jgi:hypothetical protein